MDFGVLGLDGASGFSSLTCSDPETKLKWYESASGFLHKQERSGAEDEDLRTAKFAKVSDDLSSSSSSKGIMLCFSSARNAGCNYGGLNRGGAFIGVRAPFTPSQWMELEHQALIYKYITAHIPVPSNLLIPITKALQSAAFSAGFLRPNAMGGWGCLNVGFSNNSAPEPGRCRRTDGKKWRCSRDAVADQKYCERHLNRGRHRSRKPVEPQPLAGATTAMAAPPSSAPQINRENGGIGFTTPSEIKQSKQHNSFEESPTTEFGLVSSNSLLNPSQRKAFSLMNYPSEGITIAQEAAQTQHSLRQFFSHCPKNQSDTSYVNPQSDRTQLSISFPVDASDFRSSTSSPAHEKLTLSPLKSSQELDPILMGLRMENVMDGPNNRQANWIPISWESSMGGPLGEVLHSTNNHGGESKTSSIFNLMTEGWDNSPSLGSSPTGVLQKTAFGSLSNSSTGSSPRTESYKAHEGGGGSSSSQCSVV